MNIDPNTGATVAGWDEYAIRFKDVVTTPLLHRIKRPDYGCKLYTLQGKPLSAKYVSRAAAYIAECYYNPTNKLDSVDLVRVVAGTHQTGFKISVIFNYNGIAQEIAL